MPAAGARPRRRSRLPRSIAEGLRLRRRAVRRVLRARRTAALVVNEMAPRPHNSGHYSMDACDVSQFDLQVRTLAGLPLAAAAPAQPGHHAQPAGRPVVRRRRQAERTPPGTRCWPCPARTCTCTASSSARRGRKMGHLNITGADGRRRCAATALQAAAAAGHRAVLSPPTMILDGTLRGAIAQAARALAAGELVGLADRDGLRPGRRCRQRRGGGQDLRRQGPAQRPPADRARGRRRRRCACSHREVPAVRATR